MISGFLEASALSMETRSNVFLVLIVFGTSCGQAQAQSQQVIGTAGYLSEWEFTGAVTGKSSAGRSEFSGPITWKHIGLCSVNGPQEKHGEIRVEIKESGTVSLINATISLDSVQCTFSGRILNDTSGLMECSDAKGVPLSFSFK